MKELDLEMELAVVEHKGYVSSSLPASLLGLLAMTPPIMAQGRLVDQGIFEISRGSEIVGREEFTIRAGRQQSPGVGFTLTVQSYYPADRARPVLVSVVEYGADSLPNVARIDGDTGDRPSVLVLFEPRRITVRQVTPGAESARQYPATARALLSDELLVCLHTLLPSNTDGTVSLIDPRTGNQEALELTDMGRVRTLVNGTEMTLRHRSLGSNERARHLWYDADGRLIKIEIIAAGVVAFRTQEQ
jgi:hypothetical protein